MASCRQVESLVQAYVDGELGSSEQVVFEQHLAECPLCVHAVRSHREQSAKLFELFAPVRLQGDLTPRIMGHLPDMEEVVKSRLQRRRERDPRSWSQRFGAFMPAFAPALLLLLGLALWVFWPSPQAPGDPVGMILHREGHVLRSHEQLPEWRMASLATPVIQGEWLETAAESTLMIGLNGGSQVKVAPNSRVKVIGERRVQVETGRVWLNVSKEERLFRVFTAAGDITVFGTTFEVDVAPETAVVTVAQGEVQVENDLTFTMLRPGQMVELALQKKPLKPQSIDPEMRMAWAGTVKPDAQAQSVFLANSTVSTGSKVMRAEQVFVVAPEQRNLKKITAIKFMWNPDLYATGHSGYDVYVSDTNMNPLFLKHIPAEVFQNKQLREYTLALKEDEFIQNVSVLHIKVVPDISSGRIETSFEVEAVGS